MSNSTEKRDADDEPDHAAKRKKKDKREFDWSK